MEREGTVAKRPPAQSFIIKRPRLTKLLDDSEARIILLVAPAGYGKTTLAREWLKGREGVAWYSGRPAMADVAALASDLITAFATDDDVRDRALERVQILATRGQSPEALAKAVAIAVPPTASILVIDDCHLAASQESEALLAALTSDTPLRVVLLSRTRPAWVTSRMIVYGQAAMLEMSDLAFTNDESRTVIGQGSDAATDSLLARARGWPAVIGLAAQRGSAGLQAKLPSNDLYDFFAEDLFRRAGSDLQEALILLALGGDANADVTLAMLGDSYEGILARAWEHGFLGPETERVEIHPLLRAFLLERLDDLSPGKAECVVRTTVEVLAKNELWDECLTALEHFPVTDIIASILEESLADLLTSGWIATVRRWVDLARANQVSDPMLLLAEAEIALRDRDDSRAQILGARAGDLLGRSDAAARAYIVAARAAHFCDDLGGVTKYTELALSSTAAVEMQNAALWIAFSSAAEHSAAEANDILDRLGSLHDSRPDHAVRILNAHGLELMNSGGDVRTVVEKCELARALFPHVSDPFATTSLLNLFATATVLLGRYDRALALTDEMLTEARSTGLDFAVDHALVVRASALIGLRRLSATQRCLNEIQGRGDNASMHVVANTRLQEVRLRIASGDLRGASLLLQREPPGSISLAFASEFLAHRGFLLAAANKKQAAEDALNLAQQTPGWVGTTFLCDAGRAILMLLNDEPGANARCVEVLMRAYDKGHLDAIVTAARVCPDLVRAGSASEKCARALTELLSSSSDVDLGRRAGLEMPRVLRRHEPLSPRERDVYELLTQGRSNKDIARSLFISESTAKVHVRHIYEKLGIHSRAELARTLLGEARF